MKQACKDQRGASRREREKRWGRNEGGPGMPAVSGLAGLTPRRGRKPQGRRPEPGRARARHDTRADVDTTNSGGEPSPREDEPGFFQRKTGAGTARKTITVRPKWRGIDGSGATRKRRYDGTNNTLQGSELHERLPSSRRRGGGSVSTTTREPSKGTRHARRPVAAAELLFGGHVPGSDSPEIASVFGGTATESRAV
jgi:hypothetical protein